MKETAIRKKAIELLEKDHWHCWFPKKVKYQETDVFGVFDILAIKRSTIRWIQITSLSNIRARERKIMSFLGKVKANLPWEVWGIRKDKTFKIIKNNDKPRKNIHR